MAALSATDKLRTRIFLLRNYASDIGALGITKPQLDTAITEADTRLDAEESGNISGSLQSAFSAPFNGAGAPWPATRRILRAVVAVRRAPTLLNLIRVAEDG